MIWRSLSGTIPSRKMSCPEEKELQKLTDHHVAEIDEIQRHKESELMEV